MAAEPQRPDGWVVAYIVEVVFDTNASRTLYDHVGTVARCIGCGRGSTQPAPRLPSFTTPATTSPASPTAPTIDGHAETGAPVLSNPPSLVSGGRR